MTEARQFDLRSDTVTVPTSKMWSAMTGAKLGDDVYGEDPTVTELESLGASMLGKECGLFLPSGTMGNQASVMAHTSRGDEVIVDADSHIFYYEAGGLALLSGVQPRTISSDGGIMDPDRVRAAVRPDNLHCPRTALLCLENTHNRAGGRVVPVAVMDALMEVALDAGIPVHVDGARIFNAATALGVPAARLVEKADSVMFCLSKGLSAPIGSVVVGSEEFIARARRSRKVLGGGMRQAGVIAAAGIVALEEMTGRLEEDHKMASRLVEELAGTPGIALDPGTVETNMVMLHIEHAGLTAQGVVDALRRKGVLAHAPGPSTIRLVTHKDLSMEDVLQAARLIREVMTESCDPGRSSLRR